MAYIGREPQIGNFQVCDAIVVVDAQAAYTMQVSSVDVSPESANHMLVSLNGVIQKPTDAFTVSGSTITFASALETGDVIDFIQILGNVLDLGVPSDGTVSTAKIVDGAVTSAKLTYPLTTFSSTGIDDNADATAITINSSEQVGIGTASPSAELHISKSADGSLTELILENVFTDTGSTDEIVRIQGRFGGFDASYITTGKEEDFTSAGNRSSFMSFTTRKDGTLAERMRIDGSGTVLIGKTSAAVAVQGHAFGVGDGAHTSTSTPTLYINRLGSDGELINFYNNTTQEGSISVSGATVEYNGFTGTHWSRFIDESKPDVLRGTVMESLDEMTDWYNAEFEVSTTEKDADGNDVVKTTTQKQPYALKSNEQEGDVITYNFEGTDYQATIVKQVDVKHVMSKISDTVEAKNVYGVFSHWDNDDLINNDFYVASVGSYVVRIKAGQTVSKGDLLQSNGDGTAKVQADDAVRSSSFAKVLSITIIETYEDGSFIVPCSLMC
jgi:hypothetical protein